MDADVLIIGGGIAGLSCAKTLTEQGIPNIILEASDALGGRVRTDNVDGFLLDRGFQVFQTAYPEAKRILDYTALKLRSFHAGALVRFDGLFHRVSDPFRHPIKGLQSLLNPIGTTADKFRVAKLRKRVLSCSLQELFQRPETSTLQYLQELRFTPSIIDRFFRPFLGGVFLDPKLNTSSRMAEFVLRVFAAGDTAIPAEGMGAIAQLLTSHLQPMQVRTHAKVIAIQDKTVSLDSGETMTARAIVIATEGSQAAKLVSGLNPPSTHGVICVYYAASEAPIQGPYLILNGEGNGPVNHLCVLSQIAPTYAPANQHLISVTILKDGDPYSSHLADAVRQQLIEWFGLQVKDWRHLQTYTVKEAQPIQVPPLHNPYSPNSKLGDGLFVCGDWHSTATIDGALRSGRHAAEAVQKELNQ